ncbi:MAG: endonuclease III [Chthoniobacterales bacterium]
MTKKSRHPSTATRHARASELLPILRATYPDAHCELNHEGAFQLLVATILSAQCTDVRVNMVTPALFKKYPDAGTLAAAKQEDVEDLIRSTGFFRNKAKNLIAAARSLVREHAGEVPRDLEMLTDLPGVGRKTANVVLGNAYRIEAGIVVDTHVARLSQRLGLTKNTDPVKIEKDLVKVIPQDDWTLWSHLLIWHGRRRCPARKPDCPGCELRDLCPSAGQCAAPGPAARSRSAVRRRSRSAA